MKKKPLPLLMMNLYHKPDPSNIYPFYSVENRVRVRMLEYDNAQQVTDFNLYLSPVDELVETPKKNTAEA